MNQIWGADWWEAGQAVGTLAAVVLSLLLAFWEGFRARRSESLREKEREERSVEDRRTVASLVSAWVEVEYEPASTGTHFLAKSRVIVANESNEPVFNVHVLVGVGQPPVQVGPLAVPAPIAVLPPRRQRSWDVSLGLLAHTNGTGNVLGEPVARINFSDVRDVRWRRDFQGWLSNAETPESSFLNIDPEEGEKQLGVLDNMFNPMTVVLMFLEMIREENTPGKLEELRAVLARGVPYWESLTEPEVDSIRQQLAGYGLAAHCWYRGSQVAYVRLVRDDDARQPVESAGFIELRAPLFITLVFYAGEGWRIFSYGGSVTHPDWIHFPEGTISDDPRVPPQGRPKR